MLAILEPRVRWVEDTEEASAVTPMAAERRGRIFAFRVGSAESVHGDLADSASPWLFGEVRYEWRLTSPTRRKRSFGWWSVWRSSALRRREFPPE
ncbi:MAG: hypothetical protein ACOC8K_02330 [Gemmatimonadota bacterium]